jgi:kynureninase
MEFPSIQYLCRAQERLGAATSVVPSMDGIIIESRRLIDAIDDRTLLVLISHVLYKSSFVTDVQAVVRKAHEVGALVILDVYQSAGTLPINLKALDVDVAIGGCLKWLCGGPGAAFLYVRPDLRPRLEPKLTGWVAHRNPFEFEPKQYLREDAFRFLNGTPHIPCLYAARPGLEIIGAIGVERIRRKSVRQIACLAEMARQEGFRLTAPDCPEERGGTLALQLPHAARVAKELLRREFLVDFRPGAGIRISPHFYTKDEELEAIIREIRTILDTGAF